MSLLIDCLIVFGLISVCVSPIILIVGLVKHTQILVKHTQILVKLYEKVFNDED